MDDLGIRALAVIGAVATHRSFRGAAKELEISPSSVSHIVANLERRFGIRLFRRSTRSVSLTEAGDSFLNRVKPALAAINGAIEGIHELRDRPAGLVRINASSWGAERLLPIVLEFMHKEPDVRVDLVCEGRIIDIIAEGFDAGLRLESLVSQDMISIPLGIPESLMIVAAPSYLKARGTPTTPGDLLSHECIRARLPSGSIMGWEMGRRAESAEPKVSGRLIVGSLVLSARAAAAGAGIAYVEAREAAPFLASGELVQVMPDWTPPLGTEALYYPASRLPSAAFRAFVDFVRATRPRKKVRGSSSAASASIEPTRRRSVTKPDKRRKPRSA
jgi:DNA-binding transcriptional LysR family regulator